MKTLPEYGYEGVYEVICSSDANWTGGDVAKESELLKYGLDPQDCEVARLIGYVRLPELDQTL